MTLKEIFPLYLTELASHSLKAVLLAADLAEEHGQRIVEFVHHALFERNDGVVRDSNLLGADLVAAFCDVAKAQSELILEHSAAVHAFYRLHFHSAYSTANAR